MRAEPRRHPLSAAFGDMPAAEFAELVADLKRNGLIASIITAKDGSILDGWHRYRACLEAGIKPRFEPFDFIVEPAAETAGRTMTEAEFVCAQNAHRRHLRTEQRRRIVAELLKAAPDKSDRMIARMAHVDHKTVGAVRRQAETTGEIPQLRRATGKDGKDRPVTREQRAAELLVKELSSDELALARAARARADAEFHKYAAMRKGIKAQMSEDDYRFLLNVLHPDRAPDDRREKFARAFDIVRKLDGYIKATK